MADSLILMERGLSGLRLAVTLLGLLLFFRCTAGWNEMVQSTAADRARASCLHRSTTLSLALAFALLLGPETVLRLAGIITRPQSAIMLIIGTLLVLFWQIGTLTAFDVSTGKRFQGAAGYAFIPIIAIVYFIGNH